MQVSLLLSSNPSTGQSPKYNVKILLLGDGGVGKTAIRRRFMGQGFKSTYMETIGSDFSTKSITIDHNLESIVINFQIWDLAGQPKFQNIRQLFYTGSQGLIFVFDLTRLDSLENLKLWVDEVLKNGISKVPVLLIGNKIDLQEEGFTISNLEDDKKIAEFIEQKLNEGKYSVQNIRTSAKTGFNIDKAFDILGKDIYISLEEEN